MVRAVFQPCPRGEGVPGAPGLGGPAIAPISRMMTRSLRLSVLMMVLNAVLLGNQAWAGSAAPAPRFVFLINTAQAMGAQRSDIAEAVRSCIRSGVNGQMTAGDVFMVWTFGEDVAANSYPPMIWSPRSREAIAEALSLGLDNQRFAGSARFDRAVKAALNLAPNSDWRTVVLITDAAIPVVGVPFDQKINETSRRLVESEASGRLVAITLLARDGQVLAWSVEPSSLPSADPDRTPDNLEHTRPVQQPARTSQLKPGVRPPAVGRGTAAAPQPEPEPQSQSQTGPERTPEGQIWSPSSSTAAPVPGVQRVRGVLPVPHLPNGTIQPDASAKTNGTPTSDIVSGSKEANTEPSFANPRPEPASEARVSIATESAETPVKEEAVAATTPVDPVLPVATLDLAPTVRDNSLIEARAAADAASGGREEAPVETNDDDEAMSGANSTVPGSGAMGIEPTEQTRRVEAVSDKPAADLSQTEPAPHTREPALELQPPGVTDQPGAAVPGQPFSARMFLWAGVGLVILASAILWLFGKSRRPCAPSSLISRSLDGSK